MRTIRVSAATVAVAAFGSDDNFTTSEVSCVRHLVQLDWPELRLTDDQITANAIALSAGKQTPYPDRSLVTIELPIVRRQP